MEEKLYYQAPSDEIFEEVKAKVIEIWQGYDNTYGYASEKIARVKEIQNVSDNVMTIAAMFDHINLAKLAEKLSPEARSAMKERMISGGNPPESIPF